MLKFVTSNALPLSGVVTANMNTYRARMTYVEYSEILHPHVQCCERLLKINDGVVVPYVINEANTNRIAELASLFSSDTVLKFDRVMSLQRLIKDSSNTLEPPSRMLGRLAELTDITLSLCDGCANWQWCLQKAYTVEATANLLIAAIDKGVAEYYRGYDPTFNDKRSMMFRLNCLQVETLLSLVEVMDVLHSESTSRFNYIPRDILQYVIRPYVLGGYKY